MTNKSLHEPNSTWEVDIFSCINICKRELIPSLILIILSAACGAPSTVSTLPVIPVPTQTSISLTETPTAPTQTFTPTTIPTLSMTPLNTLKPIYVTETLQPLIKEPMNCAVPCFWGIIPGKTHLDENRIFFSKLGFMPFEGADQNSPSSGIYFYTILYNSGNGSPYHVTLYVSNNLVENIMLTPDIPKPKEGVPREWIAYSPETLIKRYGKPSRVQFSVGFTPLLGIDMIMYFDVPSLIVHYSGYLTNIKSFCPSTAPFDFVRLWMGRNPPNTPSFDTVPLEKATSLTMDQFAQLMAGDPKKACFTVNLNAFQ